MSTTPGPTDGSQRNSRELAKMRSVGGCVWEVSFLDCHQMLDGSERSLHPSKYRWCRDEPTTWFNRHCWQSPERTVCSFTLANQPPGIYRRFHTLSERNSMSSNTSGWSREGRRRRRKRRRSKRKRRRRRRDGLKIPSPVIVSVLSRKVFALLPPLWGIGVGAQTANDAAPMISALTFPYRNPLESDTEHAQRVPGAEQGGVPPTQVKLKERQKFFEEAFQQDMEQYLSTGYLQITERRGLGEGGLGSFLLLILLLSLPVLPCSTLLISLRGPHPSKVVNPGQQGEPIGSMSSMEVNVDMLEQMDLMDMSDHEALDVFLHSGAEDNSAASPGPDVESFTAEISLQVPTQAELRHKLSSLSSTCTDSASQDTEAGEEEEEEEEEEQEEEEERGGGVVGSRRRRPPVVVTLDEEEVHVDTALLDRAEEQSSTDCEENRPKD
ncbi:Dysbindin Biogenesis of lysosome-related organelles complex 1 subunit 8 [Takifugu flavidus]|uniref:Dysbindin Biogenesis of lysosome-related organelles complex 1 subunit 8 n=1 Tax=Takifugu flavidus TaxID=433684 RepID=A0A5C6NDR2_9TELE|nr:Dysbindin Biogenesis of lysosome-related organelles complex 1 subunit 8 [Takifugu flavidus]